MGTKIVRLCLDQMLALKITEIVETCLNNKFVWNKDEKRISTINIYPTSVLNYKKVGMHFWIKSFDARAFCTNALSFCYSFASLNWAW